MEEKERIYIYNTPEPDPNANKKLLNDNKLESNNIAEKPTSKKFNVPEIIEPNSEEQNKIECDQQRDSSIMQNEYPVKFIIFISFSLLALNALMIYAEIYNRDLVLATERWPMHLVIVAASFKLTSSLVSLLSSKCRFNM
jgi:hypothetical protein